MLGYVARRLVRGLGALLGGPGPAFGVRPVTGAPPPALVAPRQSRGAPRSPSPPPPGARRAPAKPWRASIAWQPARHARVRRAEAGAESRGPARRVGDRVRAAASDRRSDAAAPAAGGARGGRAPAARAARPRRPALAAVPPLPGQRRPR